MVSGKSDVSNDPVAPGALRNLLLDLQGLFSEPNSLVERIAVHFEADAAVFWRRDKYTSSEFAAEGIYNRPVLQAKKKDHNAYFLLSDENVIFRDEESSRGVILGSIFEPPFGKDWASKRYTDDLIGIGIKFAAICPIETNIGEPFGAISLYFTKNIQERKDIEKDFRFVGSFIYSLLVNVVGEVERLTTDQSKLGHEILSQVRSLRRSLEKIDGLVGGLEGLERKPIQDANISVDLIEALARERSFQLALSRGKRSAIMLDLRDEFNSAIQPIIQRVSRRRVILQSPKTNTDDRIFVRMAPTHLTDLLANLAENAVKYSSMGGFLQVMMNVEYPARDMRLSVTNPGTGIPEDERELIWEPSYRSRIARSSGVKGEGLGLNIVADICRLYGMEYGYHERKTGKGSLILSTFWVSFPSKMVNLRDYYGE
jgi:signal transduction histidine kinase